MEKVIRDGKVAVLYSPGFGAGWSSWGAPGAAIFHPTLVKMVEDGQEKYITEDLVESMFGVRFYTGGARDLTIAWLDEGMSFQIDEYDGSESISIRDNQDWIVA